MRVIILGTPRQRRALRDALDHSPPEVIAEFASLTDARNAGVVADAVVAAAPHHGDADADAGPERLTSRELEVLELMAEGLSNKAIAGRLGISDQTVKFHVSSIHGKLGAANRTDAVRRGVHRGLLTL